MQRHAQGLNATALLMALIAIFSISGCNGGSSKSGNQAKNGRQGGSITYLMGTAPDYLDPQLAYTSQAVEPHWITYTPLLTYRHAEGKLGTELIPGLAKSLPTISRDGKTYTFVLRKGLVFSDGKPVKASDFPYTLERAIKLNWGGKSFLTNYIKGASEFDKGKSDSISGIRAEDRTGKITVKLNQAYGAFANVVAFPATGLIPRGTPMRNLSNTPPPGVGAYRITDVAPNRTFTLVKNREFKRLNIPNIPQGNLDKIVVKITSNTQSEAQEVLNNQADVFDVGDVLPPALLPAIQSQAADRFKKVTHPSTFYFFLNGKEKPFNNEMARQAVNYALDRRALQRLASGFLKPECYFIPEGITGHPTKPCPWGDPNKTPDLKRARELVQKSGTAGTKITVWGQQRSPRREYVDYYTNLLNKIGYKATSKIITDTTYFPTVGNEKTRAQTGFASWLPDFPNPSDFYLLLDRRSIQPVNNMNFSNVDDPFIQGRLKALNAIPAAKLNAATSQWQKLDGYTASKAYEAVFGSQQVPIFFSNRLNFKTAVFHPLMLNDWSSFSLK